MNDIPELPLRESWEQLALLRELTKSTGVIHEAQILQLKTWGWVAVQRCYAKKTVIELDVESRRVTYNMQGGADALPDVLEGPRLAALTRSVRNLLGNEWKATVILNDTTILGAESSERKAFTAEDDDGSRQGPSGS